MRYHPTSLSIVFLLFIFTVCFTSSIHGDPKDPRVVSERYFANYFFNAWYEIEGRFEFNPDSISRANYYVFGYDNEDRLVNVCSNMFINSKTGTSQLNSYPHIYEIEYIDGHEYRRYYDMLGRQCRGPERAYGIRIKMNPETKTGEIVHLYHDDTPSHVSFTSVASRSTIKLLKLDDKGRIIEKIGLRVMADSVVKENVSVIVQYGYDENDYLNMYCRRDADGSYVKDFSGYSVAYYINDSIGNKLTTYYSSNELDLQNIEVKDSISIRHLKYNLWGQLIEYEYGDYLYVVDDTSITYVQRAYDSIGNHIATYLLDSNKNPVETISVMPAIPVYII